VLSYRPYDQCITVTNDTQTCWGTGDCSPEHVAQPLNSRNILNVRLLPAVSLQGSGICKGSRSANWVAEASIVGWPVGMMAFVAPGNMSCLRRSQGACSRYIVFVLAFRFEG
jgi:hypothetical protein